VEKLAMRCKMKYVIGLVVSLLVLSWMISEVQAREDDLMKKLTGYIEVANDSGIQRIALPAGRTVEIFKKRADYLVNDFDLSPDAKHRVLSVIGVGYDFTRLCTYSGNGKLLTILNKNGVEMPAFSPDGKHIAYLSCPYNRQTKILANDDCYLFLISPDGSSDTKVSDLPLMPFRPSWFPDGKRLTVITRNFEVHTINIDNGEQKRIIDFGVAAAVSHNGKYIAYLSNDIDASTRKRIIDSYNISKKDYDAIITEKGNRQKKMLELAQYSLTHAIYVYDIEASKTRKITGPEWVEEPPVWSPDDKYLAYSDRSYVVREIYVLDVNTGEKIRLKGCFGTVMLWRNEHQTGTPSSN
jgi:tricorn protease-like protein